MRPAQAMENESMKNDHHRIPRFPQDRRLGLDIPTLTKTELYARLVAEATIDAILDEHVLAKPLTVCRNCRNFNENTGHCESDEHCRIKHKAGEKGGDNEH